MLSSSGRNCDFPQLFVCLPEGIDDGLSFLNLQGIFQQTNALTTKTAQLEVGYHFGTRQLGEHSYNK